MTYRYTNTYHKEALKEVRKNLKVTKRSLALALGCTEVTIGNYERGRNLPSGSYIDLLHRLCRERNIEPPEFYNTNYRTIL